MGKFKPSVEIPKNVKLTEEYVESNRENIIDMMEWFLNYPDIYIDMMASLSLRQRKYMHTPNTAAITHKHMITAIINLISVNRLIIPLVYSHSILLWNRHFLRLSIQNVLHTVV